jgi:hypothetical protein
MRTNSRPAVRGQSLGVDENVDLLTDVELAVFGQLEAVDDLQHAGVDPLAAGAGEAGFGDDEGLNPDELEWNGIFAIAFDVGLRDHAWAYADGVLLINVTTDLQLIQIA